MSKKQDLARFYRDRSLKLCVTASMLREHCTNFTIATNKNEKSISFNKKENASLAMIQVMLSDMFREIQKIQKEAFEIVDSYTGGNDEKGKTFKNRRLRKD